ncbi:hypothetical protein BH11VER1_BH11VER1_08630 [soil metagenome]
MRIPCIALVYFDFPIVKSALDFLLSNAGRLSLSIVENPSPQTTPLIRPYIEEKLQQGLIENYFLFDQNISNNAFEIILDYLESTWTSPYVLVTDGDIKVDHTGWLDEQITILENCPEVFACAVSLDMGNLPIKCFPEAGNWVPAPIDRGLYLEGDTGIHLTLFRTSDLKSFLSAKRENGWKLRDGYIHNYARATGRKWAKTKLHHAIHLTWDAYGDLEHPYTKMKLSKSFDEIWNHNDYCSYQRFSRDANSETGVLSD